MNTIERLKELDERYPKNQCVFNATEIFTRSEINEVFDSLPKLLAFVAAWDDCQTVTANQMEKMSVLLAARAALERDV